MTRFLLTVLVVLCIACTATAATPNYNDDKDYENFVGRLYIDDVKIDVALYESWEQKVVDRDDSAAYMGWPKHRLIGDHNNQAFETLGKTKVGAIACIEKEDGTLAYYKCKEVFKGNNNGGTITDNNGNDVTKKADILMYTCYNGWKNIWVTLWYETISPEIVRQQNNFITAVENALDKMLSTMDNPVEGTSEYEEIELTLE